MQTSRKAKEVSVFDLLKLLTKHIISQIDNLIMELLHGLQDPEALCAPNLTLCSCRVNG